jgi:hypothetical protein
MRERRKKEWERERKPFLFNLFSFKSFQPGLMFTSKTAFYPSETPFRCSLLGRLLALPTSIRRGWKGMPGRNTSLLGPFVSCECGSELGCCLNESRQALSFPTKCEAVLLFKKLITIFLRFKLGSFFNI